MSAFCKQPILYITKNVLGRDFVVGDIHGCYDLVLRSMDKVKFDSSRDRIFSVGDLIDRGPDSHRSLKFLSYSWVYAVRGNHEDMLLDLYEDGDPDPSIIQWMINQKNGLDWWLTVSDSMKQDIIESFKKLPIVIELETERGQVGLVHADIPNDMNWSQFLHEIQSNNPKVMETALWGRHRIKYNNLTGVDGISRIYVGHTPVNDAQRLKNIFYLDTGAVYGVLDSPDLNGKMSFMDVACKTIAFDNIHKQNDAKSSVVVIDQKEKNKTPFSKY